MLVQAVQSALLPTVLPILQASGLPAPAVLAPAGTCGAPAQTTRGRATEPAQAAPASGDQAAAVATEAAAAFGSGSGDVTEEEEVGGEERPADGMAWEVCALCCGVLPWRHKGACTRGKVRPPAC